MLQTILNSLAAIFEPLNILAMCLGVAIGLVFGSLPGLSATMAVAITLPFTYTLETSTAMFLLLGIYASGIYAGSISAILISTPGTPASAATIQDGYALARQGRAGEALRVSLYASVVGGVFSALVLLFAAPQVARVALNFGPAEFFALAIFGLAIISSVSGDSVVKGVVMALLGMLVATIGTDPMIGIPRLTFGIVDLQSGVNLIPALVGLFAIAEVVRRAQYSHTERTDIVVDSEREGPSFYRTLLTYPRTLLKSSAIGTAIGSIPGTGASISTFLAYNEAKRSSRNKEEYGNGSPEAVAAAESSNNGTTGATLIPTLTLGIPGDTVTAVLLGALALQGISAGPRLFIEQAELIYTIMIGMIIIQLIMLLEGRLAAPIFAKVASIPTRVLVPFLLILCFVGSYAVNNTVFDAQLMMFFGLVALLATFFDFPVVPMLLGIILGPIAEESVRQALISSQGSLSVFYNSPIAVTFISLSIVSFLTPIIKDYWVRRWT